jgi:signal transduction histidine kinase
MLSPVKRPRILVVEDETIVARDIQAQLLDLGYEPVGHATQAEQAIALVGELRPNLVLMDIQLIGAMDGISAAQIIRTQFAVPVVFLTAFAAEDTLARAKLTEPFGYILKPFSERDLRTVLEMALYKHQAESKLQESTHQLRALSRRVLEAQEAERRRVALELHDELGQALTAIKINLQTENLVKHQSPDDSRSENIRIIEDVLQQVRNLALALRPSMLDDLGLAPALRWIAEQMAARSNVVIHFHPMISEARLAPEIETACFRIVQEALTNIARHARAQQVDIDLRYDDNSLTLSVRDDGCGFDLTAMRARAVSGGSIGVLGMQERAKLIDAQLDITSIIGKGSTVHLHCPLPLPFSKQGEPT